MNADAHMMDLDTHKPVAMEMYYATHSAVDRNNRRRCADIKLEKKLGTHSWDTGFNMSIFGVSVVETYNVSTQSLSYENTSHVMFCDLSE